MVYKRSSRIARAVIEKPHTKNPKQTNKHRKEKRKEKRGGTGEMAQELIVFTALAEDSSSAPMNYIRQLNNQLKFQFQRI